MIAILEENGIKEDQVTRDAHLGRDLGADSLDVAELCMSLEEAYEIELGDDEAARVFEDGTIGEIVALVERRAKS